MLKGEGIEQVALLIKRYQYIPTALHISLLLLATVNTKICYVVDVNWFHMVGILGAHDSEYANGIS
jgi:hypothetical protein